MNDDVFTTMTRYDGTIYQVRLDAATRLEQATNGDEVIAAVKQAIRDAEGGDDYPNWPDSFVRAFAQGCLDEIVRLRAKLEFCLGLDAGQYRG